MRIGLAVSLVAVLGCGGASAPAPRVVAATSPAADASTSRQALDAQLDAGTPTDASIEVPAEQDASALEDAALAPDAAAAASPDAGGVCVVVDFALDLRALSASPDTSEINMFVLGQMDDVRGLAPRSSNVEMRHFPGAGIMYAIFRGRSARAAMDACARTTRAYLEQAPRLPIIMEPVASVTEACRPCE